MKHVRTSFPEQALYFYIETIYPSVQNGYTDIFPSHRGELDLFIPEVNTGIEYDGIAWHSTERAAQVAKEKYAACKEHSIKLIRISEIPNIGEQNCDYYIYRDGFSDNSLNIVIQNAISLLSAKRVSVDVSRDRNKIFKQYISVIKNKSIAEKYPDSVKEWDTEKNDGITPEMVNANTNKNFWWRCSYGHSYHSSPLNKLRGGQGCPICSGRQLLSGYNDLETKYPLIAKEWNYEKNYPTTPSIIMPGSVKKYWWTCENGHSYMATPNSRTASHSGCPYCGGHTILPGFNDLASTKPELLAIWDYEKNPMPPTSVFPGSELTVWWKCQYGHHWEKRISSQVKYNFCPICEGRQLVTGVNDLSTTRPEISKDWDYERNEVKPTEITLRYMTPVWWKCSDCGTNWKQSVYIRVHSGYGCPKCGYTKKMQRTIEEHIIQEKRDLATNYPQIAAEWDYERNQGLDPAKISYGSNKKVWWLCSSGHHYQAWITDRTGKKKTGCPYCSRKRRLDNLTESNPLLCEEWNYAKNSPLKPKDFSKSSRRKVFWTCSLGHEYIAEIATRAKENGTGCPYCSNKKVLPGYNDLLTKYPELASEWDQELNNQLKPDMVVSGSGKAVWWKCSKCNHSWKQRIVSRTSYGAGCPKCNVINRCKHVKCIENGKLFHSVKDAAEWAGISPSAITTCLREKSKTSGGFHWEYADPISNN